MPKLQRSPPSNQVSDINLAIDHSPSHYGSDSDLNLSSTGTARHDSMINFSKRVKRRLADTPGCTDDLLSEFKQMFEELHSSQESRFTALNSSIGTLIEQNSEIKKTVETMSSQYDALVTKFEALEKDNQLYKARIKSLETKIDILERDSKSTSIELRNIPKPDDENKQSLFTIIKNIALALGSVPQIQDTEIRDIFRTKTKAIVVNFTTTTTKENLVQRYKDYNKEKRQSNQPSLNTSTLNLPGPNKTVFLSEALTTKARRIFYFTRELVKNRKIVATWTSYGKVYIRKEEGQPPVRVSDEGELANIFL